MTTDPIQTERRSNELDRVVGFRHASSNGILSRVIQKIKNVFPILDLLYNDWNLIELIVLPKNK